MTSIFVVFPKSPILNENDVGNNVIIINANAGVGGNANAGVQKKKNKRIKKKRENT